MISYYWSRRKLYAVAKKIKGPPDISTLPFIGNAHIFLGKTEDVFDKTDSIFRSVDNEPLKFWLGPVLIVGLKNPVYLEKILSSSKFAYKHELYGILEGYLGEGLVSASGLKPKHKLHRRIIQPLLDLNFVKSSLNILQDHTDLCMEKLNQYVDKGKFDIHNVTVKCFMDAISEVILGHNIKSQERGLTDFCRSSIDMYTIGFNRLVKPWLHPDLVYDMLPDKAKHEEILKNLHEFIQETIIDSWKRRKLVVNKNNGNFTAVIDRLASYIEENPGDINGEDFMDHLMTLFTAAFDTLTIVSSFAILCFGMYPEYQTKAVKEIKSVIGTTPRQLNLDELNKLTYLDMCIKDVMRLFPIAPFILRRTLTDYVLDKWVIPKEAAILVSIFHVHRDKKYWKCPYHFYPDHFLPDEVKNRHIFAYVPFSAGPRGCIGKTLANVFLKLFLCKVLQRYEIQADGKVPDLQLRSDISVRPKQGYNCRLTRRIWE
ncbi:hypothetical protein NQ315_006825 [Exocentrus adspersus]|uniref:Cytochrome P450 n=1 Tax=Exocentrus adspersus TaxID=1586481 RepID=A0AAV8WCL7_9CUCU|nr:hypothetical protein NQ315_006825 [Exocentrus adspersus]